MLAQIHWFADQKTSFSENLICMYQLETFVKKNFKKSLEWIKSYKDKAISKTNWHKYLFSKK